MNPARGCPRQRCAPSALWRRATAARVDPWVARDEATRHDSPQDVRRHNQPVITGMVRWGQEYQGHVPRGPYDTDQNQGPRPTYGHESGEQVAPPFELLTQGPRDNVSVKSK